MARPPRSTALVLVAALILAGLTACTPATEGITGITVDADGQPVAVLAWCASRPPGGIAIDDGRSDRPSAGPSWPGQDFPVPPRAVSPETVPLIGFPPPEPPPGVTSFVLFAAADDNSFNTRPVRFQPSELAALRPEQVLITEILEGGMERNAVVTREELARRAADEC
ncbi:hypothetical protein [Micromonospora sp. MA102]|uniref:hypothetical protein n=1 Tax=Micromonospora sp. MA102 TaxID=2952755 RepID=UPI0021C670BB|nr:hypothetical protein [Micromonospora sp. MA102]